MNPPAKLLDLITALEMDTEEYRSHFDRKTARMVTVESWIISALEEGEEEELQDLPEWQKEELDIAREIVEDDGSRFVDGPDKFDFHGYRQMERFIQSLTDVAAADQLWRAIKGCGAFRCYKDTLHRLGLQGQWYRFLDEARKRFVIDWAQANDVPYVDDTVEPSR